MRVSDRIAEKLVDFGIEHVFMVTGGGSMHLNDALSRNTNLEVINMHHEQACSMAAEGFARLNNKIACVNVTTGPGGINAINGVFGAWTDSVPMIIISGQVKRDTLNYKNSKLRQLGDQENDITSMVKKITKFSYILKNANLVDNVLDHALKVSTSGRPGPVWIDVPIDIQGSEYKKTHQEKLFQHKKNRIDKISNLKMDRIIELIKSSKRPAILAGGGIRASDSYEEFLKFINKTSIPVLTAWNSHDLLQNNHKNYCGRPGTVGDRAGNFIIQNCDFLLILGSRLNIRQIGYNYKEFSPKSYKVMVDADKEELNKKTLNIDLKINNDLKVFLKSINKKLDKIDSNKKHVNYLQWSKDLNRQFSVYNKKFSNSSKINPYYFVYQLFEKLKTNDVIVTSDGTAVVTTFQGAKIKKGQRLYSNSGSASMGYGLPAAIGACLANKKRRTICIEGDGSLQQNLQELAVIKHHNLPIKIFVLANDGYHSIRQTQNNYFPDNEIGCGIDSGLYFPDLKILSKSYDINYISINKSKDLEERLVDVLSDNSPTLIEVKLDKTQEFEPKASSKMFSNGVMKSAPLHDLYPFLNQEKIDKIINFEN